MPLQKGACSADGVLSVMFDERLSYPFASYKFHRLFPLSQYDLPTHKAHMLSFPRPAHRPGLSTTARPSAAQIAKAPPPTPLGGTPLSSTRMIPRSAQSTQLTMTAEQISLNPEVDYTRCERSLIPRTLLRPDARPHILPHRPHLISLVFSDVGALTPEGVSQYLVRMFAG